MKPETEVTATKEAEEKSRGLKEKTWLFSCLVATGAMDVSFFRFSMGIYTPNFQTLNSNLRTAPAPRRRRWTRVCMLSTARRRCSGIGADAYEMRGPPFQIHAPLLRDSSRDGECGRFKAGKQRYPQTY